MAESAAVRVVERPCHAGGYDNDYVDGNPPESLCCGVCTLPLREPHLLCCCGKGICESCIERVRLQGKPCPYCKQAIKTVLDRELRSKVLDLAVHCTNKKDGCTWKGELRNVQDHISRTCRLEKQQCRYNCGEVLIRFRSVRHEMDDCPNRPLELKLESYKRQVASQFTGVRSQFIDVQSQLTEVASQLANALSQFTEYEVKIALLEAQLVCPPCKLTMSGYYFYFIFYFFL